MLIGLPVYFFCPVPGSCVFTVGCAAGGCAGVIRRRSAARRRAASRACLGAASRACGWRGAGGLRRNRLGGGLGLRCSLRPLAPASTPSSDRVRPATLRSRSRPASACPHPTSASAVMTRRWRNQDRAGLASVEDDGEVLAVGAAALHVIRRLRRQLHHDARHQWIVAVDRDADSLDECAVDTGLRGRLG